MPAIVRLILCAIFGAALSLPVWVMPRQYVSRAVLSFDAMGDSRWSAPSVDMNAYLPYVRAFLSDERYVATLAANYKLDATKLTELAAGSLRYTPQKQPKHNLWW